MKKLACVLLVIFTLAVAAVGNAEAIDVTAMTTEELIALISEAQAELIHRIGNPGNSGIDRGTYLVGKDIKAGRYIFTCVESWIDFDGNPSNYIDIRLATNDGTFGKELYCRTCIQPGAQAILTLEEGTVLRIDSCSGYLTEEASTPSWAP